MASFKEQKLQEFHDRFYDHFNDGTYYMRDGYSAEKADFLSQALDDYRDRVLEAVPEEKVQNGDSVEDLIHSGFNACRAELLKKLLDI